MVSKVNLKSNSIDQLRALYNLPKDGTFFPIAYSKNTQKDIRDVVKSIKDNEKSLNLIITQNNQDLIQAEKAYTDAIDHLKKQLSIHIATHTSLIHSDSNELSTRKATIEVDYKNLNQDYNEKINDLVIDTNRKIYGHLLIKNQTEDRAEYEKTLIKKKYHDKIDTITETKDLEQKTLKKQDAAFQKKAERDLVQLKNTYQDKHSEFVLLKNEKLKSFDSFANQIKTDFSRQSRHLNNEISELHKTYATLIQAVEDEKQTEIQTFNTDIEAANARLHEQQRKTLNHFASALKEADEAMDAVNDEYLQEKDKMQRFYASEVSMLNARISRVREQFHEEKLTLESAAKAKKEVLNSKTDSNPTKNNVDIRSELQRKLKLLGKKTDVTIRDIQRQIKAKRLEAHVEVVEIEKRHIKALEMLRAEKKRAEIIKKRDISATKLEHANYVTRLELESKRVNALSRFSKNILDFEKSKDISPIDQHLMKTASEREASLQSNLANKESEDLRQVNFAKILDYEKEIEILKIQLAGCENDAETDIALKKAETLLFFDIEKDKILKNHNEFLQTYRSKYAQIDFQLRESECFYDKDKEIFVLQNEQQIHSIDASLASAEAEIDTAIQISNHQMNITIEKMRYTRRVGESKADRLLSASQTEEAIQTHILNAIESVLKHSSSLLEKHLESTFSLLDKCPKGDEYIPKIIQLFLTFVSSFTEEITLILNAFNQCEFNLYESKITELTGYKTKAIMEDIIQKHEFERRRLLDRRDIIEQEEIQIEALIENKRKDIQVLDQDLAAIFGLRATLKEQLKIIEDQKKQTRFTQRKDIRMKRNELKDVLEKQHKTIESYRRDIAKIENQIEQLNKEKKRVGNRDNQISRLLAQQEQIRKNRENKLEKSKRKEAKIYYQAIKMATLRRDETVSNLRQLIAKLTFKVRRYNDGRLDINQYHHESKLLLTHWYTHEQRRMTTSLNQVQNMFLVIRHAQRDSVLDYAKLAKKSINNAKKTDANHFKGKLQERKVMQKRARSAHRKRTRDYANQLKALDRDFQEKLSLLLQQKKRYDDESLSLEHKKNQDLAAIDQNRKAFFESLEQSLKDKRRLCQNQHQTSIDNYKKDITELQNAITAKTRETNAKVDEIHQTKNDKFRQLQEQKRRRVNHYQKRIEEENVRETAYLRRFNKNIKDSDDSLDRSVKQNIIDSNHALMIIRVNLERRLKKELRLIQNEGKRKRKRLQKL